MNPQIPNDCDPLDLRIDAALRTETPTLLPAGFHARLRRRLHIAALLKKERQAFRRRMVRAVGLTALVSITTVSAAMYWDVSETLFWDAPGFLGYLDYLRAATNQIWLASGNPALLLSLVAVLATLLVSGACVELFREVRHR
jgi:hypothetical protein